MNLDKVDIKNKHSKEAVEFAYMVSLGLNGCCAIFAVELSRIHGYKILGFVDEADCVCHFCCQSPDGLALIDAKGYGVTKEAVSADYVHTGELRLKEYTIAEVEDFIQNEASLGCLNPPGYREAIQKLFKSNFWMVWEQVGRETHDLCLTQRTAAQDDLSQDVD